MVDFRRDEQLYVVGVAVQPDGVTVLPLVMPCLYVGQQGSMILVQYKNGSVDQQDINSIYKDVHSCQDAVDKAHKNRK